MRLTKKQVQHSKILSAIIKLILSSHHSNVGLINNRGMVLQTKLPQKRWTFTELY